MSVLTPVTPSNFDISKLAFGHPMPGTAKNDPKVNFFNMAMNYGDDGEESKLVLQCPFLKCTGLIESDQGQSSYPKDPTMYVTLNPSNPEENRIIEIFSQIYEKACEEYCKHKVKFGKRSEQDIVLRSQVTKLLKEAKYEPGCFVISVKVPHWANIYVPKAREPVAVDHRILRDVETVQAPLIVFDKFFVGAKVSIQFKLKESILRSVKERKRRIMSRAQFDAVADDPDTLEADSVLTRLAQQFETTQGSSSGGASGAAEEQRTGITDLASLIGADDVQPTRGVKRTRGVSASAALEEAIDETDDPDEPVDRSSVRPRFGAANPAAAAAGGARELLRRQPGRNQGSA